MLTDQLICGDCVEQMLEHLPERCADLVIGSPPYALKGRRYAGSARLWQVRDWVDWMEEVTLAATRVARNAVVWIVNGCVKDGRYQPAVEGLIWRMWMEGIVCERPAIWHKNAPPNRADWFGNDWEFCVAFRPPDSDRYFNGKAIATPPKYKNGGQFRQRTATGKRRLGSTYPKGKLARPRDVLRVTVGGGHMGSPHAHFNEAPFPEGIVEPFIKTLTKKGGVVLDPFCGSGTSCAVAKKLGRSYIGIDNRQEQIDLTQRRLAELEVASA
jgi:site-specific DNA-methyltransferase (adenine-specific)